MKPKILIVNGYPESGKDTFCDYVEGLCSAVTHSTINTIKYMAKQMGWDGQKTPENRKMLCELKNFSTRWFDGPFQEVIGVIENTSKFNKDNNTPIEFVLLHIREPKEIQRVCSWCEDNGFKCHTVFLDRGGSKEDQSNEADYNIEDIQYDYWIFNEGGLEALYQTTKNLIEELKR